MTEHRRNAVRITHGGNGRLQAGSLRIDCLVVDISVTGARLQMVGMRLLPDRVTLVTRVANERVELDATIVRAEPGKPGPVIALQFDNGDAAGLGRLINAAQRADLARGVRTHRDRRSPDRGLTGGRLRSASAASSKLAMKSPTQGA